MPLTLYWNAFDALNEKGYMTAIATNAVEISTAGIVFMEDNGFAPPELIKKNRLARVKILDALAGIREEHGVRAWPSFQEVVEKAGIEEAVFYANEDVLVGLGLIEWPAMQLLSLTANGMSQVTIWRSRVKRLEQYRNLQDGKNLTPHSRGHGLEVLLRDILTQDGWEVETNVRASGEEHDLILHRHLEYYIMECKWVQEKTQPHLLSVLRDRVTARLGMRGLFVSISGFTPQAIKDTADRLEQAMILLFGPQDVEAIASGHALFSALLQAKFHAAITRKEILVDGQAHSR